MIDGHLLIVDECKQSGNIDKPMYRTWPSMLPQHPFEARGACQCIRIWLCGTDLCKLSLSDRLKQSFETPKIHSHAAQIMQNIGDPLESVARDATASTRAVGSGPISEFAKKHNYPHTATELSTNIGCICRYGVDRCSFRTSTSLALANMSA